MTLALEVPIHRCVATGVHGHVLVRNLRCHPGEHGEASRPEPGRLQVTRVLRHFIQFEQIDPLWSEGRPEEEAPAKVLRARFDAGPEIGVGTGAGPVEVARIARDLVDAQMILPAVAGRDVVKVERAIQPEQAFHLAPKDGRGAVRDPVQRGEFTHRRRRPL